MEPLDQFHAMFATKDVEAFWEGVAKKGDPRLRDLQEHSLLGKRDKDRKYTVPLFIHGDGVEFQTRDSLMVWSFGGFLCRLSEELHPPTNLGPLE